MSAHTPGPWFTVGDINDADTARRCLEAAWEPKADLLRARADLRTGLRALARELRVTL